MRGLWTHLERLGRRHRHPGPGRVPDRDRPPPGPRPDREPAPAPRAAGAEPRGDAGPAQRLGASDRGAGRLHECRQVDAVERAHRRRGRGGREALPDARPDHARLPPPGPPVPGDRHGRLHPQAAAPAGRGIQGNARGDRAGRPDRPRRRRHRSRRSSATRRSPPSIRCSRRSARAKPRAARLQQGRPAGSRRCARAHDPRARGDRDLGARPAQGLEELRDRIERAFEETLRRSSCCCPTREGGALAELHELAGDLEREDRAEGVLVRARIPAALAHRFADFALNGAGTAWPTEPADRRLRSRRGIRGHPTAGRCETAHPRPRGRCRPGPVCGRAGEIGPGERAGVGTGIAVEIPPGFAGLVLPRSGWPRDTASRSSTRRG